MKGKLSIEQINYVIEHLGHHVEIENGMLQFLRFGSKQDLVPPYILFTLSDEEFDLDRTLRISDIPVLYPLPGRNDHFYSIVNNNLIFHHDLLKSIFHLLSGYEEYKLGTQDNLGRFPYTDSLQFKLNIISKPIVNYYFEIILTALEEFCKIHKIKFRRKKIFSPFAFSLSHDIDRIDAYHFFEIALKIKQLIGLEKSPHSKWLTTKLTFHSMYHFANPFSHKNPFWNFRFLRDLEKKYGIRSTFFFLEKEGKHINSRYKFTEKRIQGLIAELIKEQCEIGLHGTIQSSSDLESLQRTLSHLQSVSEKPVTGIRHHYLKCRIPETFILHEQAGLVYDTSLSFAEHEGFRNSYCHPFKLFDFEKNRIINVWELPLLIMDGTLFYYRKLGFDDMTNSINEILDEAEKFNGVFSLLWHNSHFDEYEFPGITMYYKNLLEHLMHKNPERLTGSEICNRMK